MSFKFGKSHEPNKWFDSFFARNFYANRRKWRIGNSAIYSFFYNTMLGIPSEFNVKIIT